MALCVFPSAYFFSITSTFPNTVYEKGRVFPVQSLLVHPPLLLLPPNISVQFHCYSSHLQAGIYSAEGNTQSQYCNTAHLVTHVGPNFASKLPHLAPSKGVICSLLGNPI